MDPLARFSPRDGRTPNADVIQLFLHCYASVFFVFSGGSLAVFQVCVDVNVWSVQGAMQSFQLGLKQVTGHNDFVKVNALFCAENRKMLTLNYMRQAELLYNPIF